MTDTTTAGVAVNAAAREAGRRSASVLVVDDDRDHRDLLSRRLSSAGYRVSTAATGDTALQALGGVDLVLLDYKLGGRDGLEVLAQIRDREAPPAVVMVTGMGSEQVVIACMRAGAADYVIKDAQYLKNITSVVERAWRHHDIERRAHELERLALLVTSAPDRDVALHEIVDGALRLLAADHCQLLLAPAAGEDEPVVGAEAGTAPAEMVFEELRIPVSMAGIGKVADLVVRRAAPAGFTGEEEHLASTFASFAAIAISKLRQLELERSLVEELQHTLAVRRQLLAGVSHEFRTPLTAISGFAQTALAHWDQLPDDDRKSMLARIRTNAHDLAGLVEQMLDFAAVEAGRLDIVLHDVVLDAVAREAVADLSPLLSDRTVVIDVENGLTGQGDEVLLRRLLFNLISNAAKYTPDDAAIAVRAFALDDDTVRVEVADTGDGLSKADAERVFEPFWRAEQNRSTKRGSGIGLALVRDYARRMGGEAGVETEPGQGATFWFTLRR